MTLALITRHLPDYAVVGGGLLLLLFAATLRFDHLVTLTVFALSVTEIEIPGYPALSFWIRLVSRLMRWFLFLAIAFKGTGLILQSKAKVTPTHPIRTLTLVIALLAFISVVYSMDRQVTIAAALILSLVFVCAFVFLWRVVDTEEELGRFVHGIYRAIWPLIVASIVLLIFSNYEFGGGRFGGIFRNANGLGLISAMLFPIVIWEVGASGPSFRRLWACFVLACVLVGVVVSGSRSAMIGVVMSGGVLLLFRYRVGFVAFVIFALSFLLVYVLGGGALDPQTEDEMYVLFRAGSLDDLGGRTEKWEVAWDYIRERPILGYGYGTSRLVTTGQIEGSIFSQAGGIQGLDFHSSHVQTAIELGFLGVLVLEIMMFTIVSTGLSMFRRMKEESLSLLGVSLFASLLVMVGDTFVHGWLFSPGSGMSFMFWLYTALVVRTAVVLATRRRTGETPGPAAPSTEPA